MAWLNTLAKLGAPHVLDEEYQRCRRARAAELLGLTALADTSADAPLERLPPAAQDYLRSYVAMRALGGELGAVPRPDDTAPGAGLAKTWRDDHRQILLEVLSYLPAGWRAAALRALAADADVSLRWAVLFLCLNGEVAPGLFGIATSAQCARTARFRHDIVEAVRAAGAHYWLEREILDAFLAHHQDTEHGDPQHAGMAFPSAASLGFEGWLRSGATMGHPELEPRAEALRKRSSRILLVLPPIEWPERAGSDHELVNEGSPPLGLGQIAATLAAHGHYVEVFDVHRYAYGLDDVARRALEFDFVGLSTVFSTVEAACSLATRISRLADPQSPRPCLIIGGHAATLAPRRLVDSQVAFDYLVEGPGEAAFSEIVEASRAKRPAESAAVVPAAASASDSRGAGRRRKVAADAYRQRWDGLPLVDRHVFQTPQGGRYEPARTRNGEAREAHFVMSKGCDWTCAFCTEAILAGQGEVRREAEAVLAEVGFVCDSEGARHAQFIDDNVFPPLAAPGLRADEIAAREAWTGRFLSGLHGLRERLGDVPEAFSWRGLVRLEDLLAYRARTPTFLADLAASGCALLAFGVEHGDEQVRRRLKGGAGGATNTAITELVAELRAVGIASKAYFILGGAHDSAALAEKTIGLALSSGVDLAYFAIYKDFRGMSEGAVPKERPNRHFKQFAFDLRALVGVEDEATWKANFGQGLLHSQETYRQALSELEELGFKFSNLFKYSDFHDDPDLAALYFAGDGQDREAYFRLLRRAYLEFYARAEWVGAYRGLLAKGY
jgi:radical SAM superfamily enzyme YgiQ (UPF0313 family)